MTNARFAYAIHWVASPDKAAAFYAEAFGAALKNRQEMPHFVWVELATGATSLAFASLAEIAGMFPGGFAGHDAEAAPLSTQVSFATNDVAALYERAVKAGGKGVKLPTKMPWGQTWAQLRDPNGVLVSIVSE